MEHYISHINKLCINNIPVVRLKGIDSNHFAVTLTGTQLTITYNNNTAIIGRQTDVLHDAANEQQLVLNVSDTDKIEIINCHSIASETTLLFKNLSLRLHSCSEVRLDFTGNLLLLDINAVSVANLSGTVQSALAKISSAGTFNASALTAHRIHVSCNAVSNFSNITLVPAQNETPESESETAKQQENPFPVNTSVQVNKDANL
jgi:tRNA threonylcarbamoyladenosine modification (KEOPS) complex  Pcc1 subunit